MVASRIFVNNAMLAQPFGNAACSGRVDDVKLAAGISLTIAANKPMPFRRFLRGGVVSLGLAGAGTQLLDAARAWRDWRRWAVAAPSAAELYELNFWIGLGSAVAILGVTFVLYRWIGPSPPHRTHR